MALLLLASPQDLKQVGVRYRHQGHPTNPDQKRFCKVTVLAPSTSPDASDSVARSLLLPHSPFCQLKGAKFQAFKSEKQAVHRILLAYGSQQPAPFDAQNKILDGGIKDIKVHVQDSLLLKKSLPLRAASDEWEGERGKLKQVIIERTKEANDLRDRLQQTQAEYASLRSRLQLKENTEMGQVTQQLVDLNRQIGDLGHTISNYLVDAYTQAGATSLNAHQLPELKAMFLHTEGLSSLVESSAGIGMVAPDFFDYAIRSILCQQLCKHIFRPFHPNIPEPNAMSRAYPCIQSQESQVFAGRWRKDAFNSICHLIGPIGTEQTKSKVAEAILSNGLNPLLKYFFEPSAGVALEQQHRALLKNLVSSAWNWNAFLKGSVVLLGDFQPVAYRYGDAFDPEHMLEFEAERDDKTPEYILSTIGLGMVLAYAEGGGNEPKTSVICKASVITEKVFR
ncbi:hypothetical protein FRC10_007908 [Ceratobasidium sp. 414]|nr:hypothetical protein FRC10_007908 [Ceratobasidium sp. 414]